ncbi:MAG: hypothetical protein Ct9H90mP20_1400 [Candidatus Neomarinimicrobiota bacterium]|nr:MAG: hypothetical protein Ct9H90mP20_1400 [Candidatus Neomarinimicrobiota bacterium]
MLSLDYENKNIYLIDINTKKIDQITDSRFDENYPVFSNTDDVLFYTADSSGTWNLFRMISLIKNHSYYKSFDGYLSIKLK